MFSKHNVNYQSQGRTQGGLGSNPPWAWYFTKTLLPAQRRLLFSHTFVC